MSQDDLVELRSAFGVLRAQAAEVRQLAGEVLVLPVVPGPRGGSVRRPPPAPSPPLALTTQEVGDGWTTAGDRWVQQLGRRELVAALGLLGQPFGGGRLVDLEGLAESLVVAAESRLRGPRFLDVLGSVWFLKYPPASSLSSRLERLRGDLDAAILPRWLREVGANATAVLRRVGPAFRQQTGEAARGEWQLPATLTDGPWVDEVVRSERPGSIEDFERLLQLADHGKELRAPAPVTEGVRHVVRNAVAWGRQDPGVRRRLVSLIRARIGELFGETGRPRWTGLEEQLRTLRSWVAGEFMDVIFQHVRPDGMFAHQLEPRRTFWRKYGGAVESLRVYVKGGAKRLLAHPAVERIVGELDGLVVVGDLDSPTAGHAILVMELSGTRDSVTVIEGNSSAKVRIEVAKFEWSNERISFRDDVTKWAWSFERMHDEPGHWKGLVGAELARYGIRESNS